MQEVKEELKEERNKRLELQVSEASSPETNKNTEVVVHLGGWLKAELLKNVVFCTEGSAQSEDKAIISTQTLTELLVSV